MPRFVYFFFISILVLIAWEMAAAQQHSTFRFTTPKQITYTVTADGLSGISIHGKPFATGCWQAANAGTALGLLPGKVRVTAPNNRMCTIIDDAHVRVIHRQKDIKVQYDYTFSGEDCTISARVENTQLTDDMPAVQFGGLHFTFAAVPHGYMHSWRDKELSMLGVSVCYPSALTPIGASFATDSKVGIGLTPWNSGIAQTLFLWTPQNQERTKKDLSQTARNWELRFFCAQPAPAQGARSYEMRLRIGATAAWTYWLEPYKEFYAATYGGALQYRPDRRPLLLEEIPVDSKAISPQNPYGYSSNTLRFDQIECVQAYTNTLLPLLQRINSQGVVFRNLAGVDPLGLGYLPNFNLTTPELEQNVFAPIKIVQPLSLSLRAAFAQAQRQFGVVGQPNVFDLHVTWTKGGTIPVTVRANIWDQMWSDRFQHLSERGATLFYLVNFGATIDDVLALRFYRQQFTAQATKAPQKYPTPITIISEQASDGMLLSGGLSVNLRYDTTSRQYVPAMDLTTLAIMYWLVPDALYMARISDQDSTAEAQLQSAYRLHLIPVIPVTVAQKLANKIINFQKNSIDPNGNQFKMTGGK